MKTIAGVGVFLSVVNIVFAQSSNEPILSYFTGEDQLRIVPTPLVSGAYFWIRVPDSEALKGVEVIDSTGEKVNKTDITFSKMGLYMPKLKPGTYHLKIYYEEEFVYKKVQIK